MEKEKRGKGNPLDPEHNPRLRNNNKRHLLSRYFSVSLRLKNDRSLYFRMLLVVRSSHSLFQFVCKKKRDIHS